jgi:hypothetical protein
MRKAYLLFYFICIVSVTTRAACPTLNGGTISGSALASYCSGDGIADNITFSLSGAVGSNSNILIISNFNILAILPANATTYNLEGLSSTTIKVRGIAYEDGITGLVVGSPLQGLGGCYSLSTTVVQSGTFAKTAGTIAFVGGSTTKSICVNDGLADNIQLEFTGNDSFGLEFVRLDAASNITWQGSNIPNFEGTGAGTEHIAIITSCDETFNSLVGTNIANLPIKMDYSNTIILTKTIGCTPTTVCAPEVKPCPGKVLMCVNGVSTCVASNKVNRTLAQGGKMGGCIKCTSTGGRLSAENKPLAAQNAENLDFSYGPNPSYGLINIKSIFIGKHIFELYSSKGEKIWQANSDEAVDGQYKLNIENKNLSGMYLLKVSAGVNSKFAKVLLKNN